MTAPGPGGGRAAGFSLVEMLVSLVVLGLAAVLLGGGIGQVRRGLDLASHGDERVDSVAAAQFLLRQRLAAMQPTSSADTDVEFAGLGEYVNFVGNPASRNAPDALQNYRLARDPDGDLVLFSLSTLDQRSDSSSRATVGWAAQPLLHRTEGLEIRYLGRSSFAPADGLVWQDNWTHRSVLPMLIRVRVTFPPGDSRAWPDLIVRPRGAVPAAVGCSPVSNPKGCPRVLAGAA
jgi:general secretion pathway protein J